MSAVIVLHKVTGIPKMDTFGHADPYLKVYSPATASEPVHRTTTMKNCKDATFEVRVNVFESVRIVLFDEDVVSDELIGELVFGAPLSSVKNGTAVMKSSSGAAIPNLLLHYSIVGQDDVAVSATLSKSEMLLHREVDDELRVGVAWDGASDDVDLMCLAIDGSGLIVDVVYYNQLVALQGAMQHSGDHKDGKSAGVDEQIVVRAPLAPPHVYAFVFCLSGNDKKQIGVTGCSLHVTTPTSGNQVVPGVSVAGATFAVVGTMRRIAAKGPKWAFDAQVVAMGAPVYDFVTALPQVLSAVAIDPTMARELKKAQPSFQLKKGQTVTVPMGLNTMTFGLGWDSRCDVDSSCVGLKRGGEVAFTVYFGGKTWNGGVVTHGGDNTTGEGKGDDEQIKVDLDRLPLDITSLYFTVNVYTSGKSFADVSGEYCRLLDASGREMMKFHSLDNGNHNGVVLVSMYRNPAVPTQWTFEATALACDGRTVKDLVDECQDLQRKHPQ